MNPLARVPFEPTGRLYEVIRLSPKELDWDFIGSASLNFLPSIGGFVGSDILGGLLATRIHEQTGYSCLIDLGTNGEVVIGNRDKLVCASTAAGPAFEVANISMGMRAMTGAISSVSGKTVRYHFL